MNNEQIHFKDTFQKELYWANTTERGFAATDKLFPAMKETFAHPFLDPSPSLP